MNCRKCDTERTVKNGFVKGRQRYLCKNINCGYTFSIKRKAPSVIKIQIRLILIMYLVGWSITDIAYKFGKSQYIIKSVIKRYGAELNLLRNVDITPFGISYVKLARQECVEIEKNIVEIFC